MALFLDESVASLFPDIFTKIIKLFIMRGYDPTISRHTYAYY
jgi:hypothetical protein